LVVFGVILVLLSVFILQNTQSVRISYFAATGDVSLAVAMLLATAAGVLLAAIAGSLRIWQLRRRLARSSRG
jgi:putative membrane protein